MKHKEFIQHLVSHNCLINAQGNNHNTYVNLSTMKKATIPRQFTLDESLCKEICRQLGVEQVKSL
ncbi:MAG: addiction module toxin, HicA family [bacterium]|nr:addiction module toxin, HicA family [bacterium]